MERYVCIHGHFYQPPRENPWLESIELQDSAYPYHDWNERITAECYGPNAASRILDGEGRIVRIVNNYSRISFNFGPTLLSWLAWARPEVAEAVVAADRKSRERFSGHGSALAQAYNHMILPLANPRDKKTQIRWGIRDFEHRFGRKPEGMWLPETAVDLESLELLAANGIRFTILASNQVHRVRPRRARNWRDVSGGRIDPSMAYEQVLPSGRRIALFVYDGPISRAVAFEGLLSNGERFADRIRTAFSEERSWPQLAHIATDGESYGHHHRHGEMSLAYALARFEEDPAITLTNYGEFLEKHPPQAHVDIYENSSWSCVHGVERWKSDCGCSSGGHPDWNQAWRGPLRAALDWLRDELAPAYEAAARDLLLDPWGARDEYIEVILDRKRVRSWLEAHAGRVLDEEETVRALKLLEMQRHAMLMYTSCGWFFDELSGIETVQVIQYAARAIQLAEEALGARYEEGFLERLSYARSNLPEHGDGRRIYETFVRPARVDLEKVAAHYAVSYLFENYHEREHVYGFIVDREDFQAAQSGAARLATGRMRVTSEITCESALLSFGILHFGDHNLTGGVRAYQGDEAYAEMSREVSEAFSRADLPEVIRTLDRHFEGLTYSLRDLFRDERRKVLDWILRASIDDVTALHEGIFDRYAPLMQFLRNLGTPQPPGLEAAAASAMNGRLRRALAEDTIDVPRVSALLEESRQADVRLDATGLAFLLSRRLEELARALRSEPASLELLTRLQGTAELVRDFPGEPDLRTTQNLVYAVQTEVVPTARGRAEEGDEESREWLERFLGLGLDLGIKVD